MVSDLRRSLTVFTTLFNVIRGQLISFTRTNAGQCRLNEFGSITALTVDSISRLDEQIAETRATSSVGAMPSGVLKAIPGSHHICPEDVKAVNPGFFSQDTIRT